MKQKRNSLIFFILSFLILFPSVSSAVSRWEVFEKYQRVLAKCNELNMAGYDLSEVFTKLKQISGASFDHELERADQTLGEVETNLKEIESRSPEQKKREKRLAWLEVYGDLIRRLAIFVVFALILLRFPFIRQGIVSGISNWNLALKALVGFSAVSLLSASAGVIRFGESSWSFLDLQVIWVGISALAGGLLVGLMVGIVNSVFRFWMFPTFGVYVIAPLVVGFVGGIYRNFQSRRSLERKDFIFGGFLVGVIHTLIVYLPIFSYMEWTSFIWAFLLIAFLEGTVIFLFFAIVDQILKEDKRKETERELFRTQLQFLRAQINPHFLFNTLNTIASVCGEENAERARNLIVQLSTFFRRITKHEGDFVTLRDELDYLDAYLNIEKARFGERLMIQKNITLSEAGEKARIPVLALQPIVENSVKHGISKKSEGGKIILTAREEGSLVVIEIEDTGVGMTEEARRTLLCEKAADKIEDDHAGIGVRNIYERMSKLFGKNFSMSVESVRGQGTKTVIRFPRI